MAARDLRVIVMEVEPYLMAVSYQDEQVSSLGGKNLYYAT